MRLLAQLQRSSIIAGTLVAIAVYICLAVKKISKKYENVTDLFLCLYPHHFTVFTYSCCSLYVFVLLDRKSTKSLKIYHICFIYLSPSYCSFYSYFCYSGCLVVSLDIKSTKSLKIYRIIS